MLPDQPSNLIPTINTTNHTNHNNRFEVNEFVASISHLPPTERLERLTEVWVRTNEELTVIKGRVAEAKTRVWTKGEYADPHWFKRISQAARIKGVQVQRLQLEIGKVRRGINEARAAAHDAEQRARKRTFHEEFVYTARKMMSEEDFRTLCDETDKRIKEDATTEDVK